MDNTKDNNNHQEIHISELNNWNKRAQFNVQSNNIKPYNIGQMTSKPSNDRPQKEE